MTELPRLRRLREALQACEPGAAPGTPAVAAVYARAAILDRRERDFLLDEERSRELWQEAARLAPAALDDLRNLIRWGTLRRPGDYPPPSDGKA
jgi:hypothetical protein